MSIFIQVIIILLFVFGCKETISPVEFEMDPPSGKALKVLEPIFDEFIEWDLQACNEYRVKRKKFPYSDKTVIGINERGFSHYKQPPYEDYIESAFILDATKSENKYEIFVFGIKYKEFQDPYSLDYDEERKHYKKYSIILDVINENYLIYDGSGYCRTYPEDIKY